MSPTSVTSPIWLKVFQVPPDRCSAAKAPVIDSGTESRMMNGSRKLSNWAASTR